MVNFNELKGFRTLYPEQLMRYKAIERELSKIVMSYGYFPIEPPALEYGEVLTAKGGLSPDQDKELFIFKDHGGRWVGLRFDLTTPVARIVGTNYEIQKKMPLRLFYFSRMWRYEQPQKGRYREFWQFGIELIGSEDSGADAEVLLIGLKDMISLGFDKNNIEVHVSHRDLLRGVLKHAGIEDDDKIVEIIRILDKKGKIRDEDIIKKVVDSVGKDIRGKVSEEVERILSLESMGFNEIYDEYLKKIENYNELTKNAVIRLKMIFTYLKENLSVDEYACFKVDLSLARGFDYYTGMIFETFFVRNHKKEGGSLVGGGRYDNLISLFGNKKITAVGFAIGVDRIIETLDENGIGDVFKSIKSCPSVHVIFDLKNEEHRKKAFHIRNELVSKGLSVTVTLKSYSKFRKMLEKELKYADSNDIRYAIIVDDDTNDNNIIVKDLYEKKQKIMEFSEIIKIIMSRR